MTEKEKNVARRLIESLLSRGMSITVSCEGIVDIEASTKFDEIYEYATAAYLVELYHPKGFFLLVYGNDPEGSELISDYSDNDFCNEVLREISIDQ